MELRDIESIWKTKILLGNPVFMSKSKPSQKSGTSWISYHFLQIPAPKASLVVQWLSIHLAIGDIGSIPGWGTKIPHPKEQLSLRAITRESVCSIKDPACHSEDQREPKKKKIPTLNPGCQLLSQQRPSKSWLYLLSEFSKGFVSVFSLLQLIPHDTTRVTTKLVK